jgi:SAM-dependent methyltransferase
VRAALEHPPFHPGSFELVICVLALEFVADPAAVVADLARLQPLGGRLVIGVLGRFSFWALWRRLKGLFQPLLWQRARFFSRKAAVSLLRAAGYQTVVERQAIYFPPVNSAGALAVLRRLEGAGRRWTPGTAAFLVVSGIRDGRRGL